MAALTITINGVDLTDYIDQKSIRINSSGSALAATCRFLVEERVEEASWITIQEKHEIIIMDGATRLFGGVVARPTDMHDGPVRSWEVRGSDYTVRLEEEVVTDSFYPRNTPDDTIIADLFATYLPEINAVLHVDNLRNDMPELHFQAINLRQALQHICRKTGGMFYIDFDRNLHYFSADEGVNAPFSLSTEPDMAASFPYGKFKRPRDATKLINSVLVVGDGVVVWRQDAASIAYYGATYSGIIQDPAIKNVNEAEEYGDWYVARHGWSKGEPELTCWRPGARAGMRITLVNSVIGINQWYSIRKISLRCTGGYDPQYIVRMKLGYRDAPGRRDAEPLGPTTPPVPPEPAPVLPVEAGWIQEVYVATAALGVFYTPNFVADPRYIDGVPTWTAINTGITPANGCLGFKGDPWEPELRQYILMGAGDGVYRREAPGNWVSVLTLAQATVLAGSPANTNFCANSLETSINRRGHVAVLMDALDAGLWTTFYIVSYDHGATWTATAMGWGVTGQVCYGLTIGAYKGTSPYEAGQVMYTMGRSGAGMRCYRTLDGGQTWANVAWLGAGLYSADILVDPNDQSRVFFGGRNGAGPYHVSVSLDHGVTWADYDLNAPNPIGMQQLWYHLSVAMDPQRTVRVGHVTLFVPTFNATTRDDGASWDTPTPQVTAQSFGLSLVQDAPDKVYVLRLGATVPDPHIIFATVDECRTMIPKAGANANLIGGGGDSIPYNCGGVRGILQVWTTASRHAINSTEHGGDLTGMTGLLGTPQIPIAHDLLGPYHGDTVTIGPARGALIVGDSTPEWARLVIGGANTVLRSDGTDPSWGNLGGLPGDLADEQDPKDHDHQGVGSDGGKLSGAIVDSFEDFEEIAAPANPPANVARMYSRDDAGTTKLYYRRSTGVELELGLAAGALPAHDHQGVGADGGKLSGAIVDSFFDFEEIAAPANPGANVARMYSKDDAGTTKMYYRDSAGAETEIGPGAIAAHDHQGVGADGGKLSGAIVDSFFDFEEIAAPANPGANVARMYSRDDAGTTKMYYRDSAGAETELGGGFSADLSMWRADAEPAAPSAYDDEFDNAALDLVLWTEFDPGAVLTLTEGEVGLIFEFTGGVSGIYQAVPAGDFAIMTKVTIWGQDSYNYHLGLVLWEDATDVTGDLYTWTVQLSTLDFILLRWNQWDSWHSTIHASSVYEHRAYLRIRRISSTYYFDYSLDGIGWVELWSGGLAFAPDHFGIGGVNGTGAVMRSMASFFRYTNSGVLNQIMSGDRLDYVRT